MDKAEEMDKAVVIIFVGALIDDHFVYIYMFVIKDMST